MPTLLDPFQLHTQRVYKGWTQQDLSRASGLSLRQIVTLESDLGEGETGRPVRSSTLEKLCDALGLREAELTARKDEARSPTSGRRNVGSIPVYGYLSYDLLQHRYGVSMKDLVAVAPMLFMLAAKTSLAWRREAVETSRTHLEELKAASGYTLSNEIKAALSQAEQELEAEALAIERGELFTPSSDEMGEGLSSRFLDWVDAMAEEPDDLELVMLRKADGGPLTLYVHHNVCRGTLFEIAGRPGEAGAEAAIYALVSGKVRIPDIPTELMTSEKRKDRIAWLGRDIEVPDPEKDGWAIEACPSLYESLAWLATRGPARPEEGA